MANQRFHINNKTGEPGVCVARIACRFGGPGDHYPSELDARNSFERLMARENSFQMVTKGEIAPLTPGVIFEKDHNQLAAKIAPGTYFIGDPFVLLGTYDQEGWNDYVAQVENDMGWENDVDSPKREKVTIVGANYDGMPLASVKTYNGSGLHWSVAPPRRIASDAGLIAPVPIAILEKLGLDPVLARNKRMGFLQEFKEPVNMYRDNNGNIHFDKLLLVAHNDTLPDNAFDALDEGDKIDSHYALEERRFKTYQRVVSEHHARTVEA